MSDGSGQSHIPVMVDRVVELLVDAPPGVVVDCTVGAGGHARSVLEARTARHGTATLVGLDRDPEALGLARESLADISTGATLRLVHATFEAFDEVLDRQGIGAIAGVLYDLGMSSMQVDRAERGFSYRHRGPLDMRMDPAQKVTAAQLVNHATRAELARIIGSYGEERFAQRIAAAIVRRRPFEATDELADTVREAIPAAARRRGPHPATRTFQALRIAVNRELEALEASLPRAIERLGAGGVCVVLSYHSLEDRVTKQVFADAARGCICPPGLPACLCGHEPLVDVLTRRPERPSASEIAVNPRARAARLRAVRRRAPTTPDELS
ncbi:MAG: 16S rRNA (cytosine(1402)-N(4))-methyltransferase RsmH [Actinomycetota bacterium]|nr:16S rRNA (cytosine(1402)-N(4))-methyltransferase RsmH [Actinomycetota bacterium]